MDKQRKVLVFSLFSLSLLPASPFIRGDPNGDAAVDLSDAVFILNTLFCQGFPQPACLKPADTNDDGSIDISDPIYVLRFLFAAGPPPPPPFPDCGEDPTPDRLAPCTEPQSGCPAERPVRVAIYWGQDGYGAFAPGPEFWERPLAKPAPAVPTTSSFSASW